VRSGGRVLPFGQGVYLVVLDDVRYVQVSARCMDQVVAADAVSIPVAVGNHHGESVVGQLRPGGYGERPAVDREEAVDMHVVGQLASAANTADD